MTRRFMRRVAGGRFAPRRFLPSLFGAGLASAMLAAPAAAAAAELPRDPDALVQMIGDAITTKDYAAFEELVFWEGAGKIKRNIVRFELNRGLGRKVRSITFEPFPPTGMDGVLATGKLEPNMEITNRVRVIFDEPDVESTGKPPTAVFLVGKIGEEYRIGLVNRKRIPDDD